MAADRAKTTLMISLIIFVMIAFILAVTTYLGFQQKAKEQQTAESARGDMEKANSERDAALDQFRRVRDVIGTDKDTADAIEAERNELFDARFANFDKGDRKLRALVDWLADSIKAKDEDIRRLEAEKAQIRKEQEDAVKQARALQQVAEKARDDAVAAQQTLKTDFDQRWAQHEKAQQEMRTKQEGALAMSEQTRAITEELAKLGPLLSPELRRKYEAAPPPDQPEPWPERVRFVFLELKNLQKTVTQLNATLAKLRVADPELQELVRDSIPKDERIDGFDGRIASVNAADRSVVITCDSTAGMRPGLVLSVFAPDDPRPQGGSRKATVEIVQVESRSLARARILQDSATSPILAGDGVASSLWAPGAEQEIVIVGYVRFAEGGKQDAETLAALAERHGARVVDAVTPQTVLVVDGGLPRASEGQAARPKDWKPANETLRKNALARARELGVRVVSLDGLLDMLGLDREMLDGRRLPTAVGAAP